MDGHRLAVQQEAHYRRSMHGRRGRTGGHHSRRRLYRPARRVHNRLGDAHRMLLHGSGGEAEIQV